MSEAQRECQGADLLRLKLLSNLEVLHGLVIVAQADGCARPLQVQLGNARGQPDGLREVCQSRSIIFDLLQHPVSGPWPWTHTFTRGTSLS